MSDRSGPCLILLKGHPGCGKSTLGQRIASLLRCPLIDKDDARDSLHPLALLSNPGSDLNAISYDIMLRYVDTQLRLKLNVLCDSPLSRVELFHRAIAICESHSAQVTVIEVECKDEATWKQRLETRGQENDNTHKPRTWDELQSLIKSYNGANLWPKDIQVDHLRVPFELLRVDTSSEESISHLLDLLQLRLKIGSAAASCCLGQP